MFLQKCKPKRNQSYWIIGLVLTMSQKFQLIIFTKSFFKKKVITHYDNIRHATRCNVIT